MPALIIPASFVEWSRHEMPRIVRRQRRGLLAVYRRSVARHSMGQCAKCGETNHVTARCRHRDKVQCRVCGSRGHKEKHHTEQNYC